jgi:hypothetical protein
MLCLTRCSDAVDRLSAPFRPMVSYSPHDSRVIDRSNGQRIKPHQAESRINSGVAIGIYENDKLIAIEKPTLAQIIEFRAKEEEAQRARELYFLTAPSKRGDYLPILEPDGHHWEPPKAEKYTQYMRSELVVAARQFCQQSSTLSQ